MRGKYYMPDWEITKWRNIISKDLEQLHNGCIEEADYTNDDVCPSNIRRILGMLPNIEFLESEDNGWQHDNWSYFKDTITNEIFVLFYCGETFKLTLYLQEPED